MKFEFFATTAKGMEELLVKELNEIGAVCGIEVDKPVKAGVPFRGPIEAAYRACLYSRIANRILLPLKTFPAPTPEKLYGAVKSIRWSDHLTPDETISVDFTSSHSQISHSHYGALKTKDAICDQMTSIHGSRPSVDTKRPDLRINVYLNNDQATISLDLSGNSLHQRGYRVDQREAPMKETLAAAVLKLAGFEETLKNGGGLVDPMCGSGTLVLEAAQIAAKVAPGLGRDHFGFQGWKKHDSELWEKLKSEAQSLRITDPKKIPQLTGYDSDPRAIQVALENLEAAGLHGFAHFEKRELEAALPPPHHATGLFVVNPPYGERLGEEQELIPLYRSLGDAMKQRFKGWKGGIITGSSVLAKEVGLKAARRHVLFNGAIECRLLTYDLY